MRYVTPQNAHDKHLNCVSSAIFMIILGYRQDALSTQYVSEEGVILIW